MMNSGIHSSRKELKFQIILLEERRSHITSQLPCVRPPASVVVLAAVLNLVSTCPD
jgi:hypothetical protein